MKIFILIAASILSQSAIASTDFIKDVKGVFQQYTNVDAADWYNKGDTAFAEFTGRNLGVYQNIKASVRKNEVNIKMWYAGNGDKPSDDDFFVATTTVCNIVFRQVVLTSDQIEKLKSWDDNVTDPLDFMSVDKLQLSNGDYVHKNINGWDVKIKHSGMNTSCSAQKA